jgi:hypothetical protein
LSLSFYSFVTEDFFQKHNKVRIVQRSVGVGVVGGVGVVMCLVCVMGEDYNDKRDALV